MTRSEIERRLIEIVRKEKDIPEEQLRSDAPLAEAGIDSLDALSILFAIEEPPVEIGVAGIMAAKPNQPPMHALRKWIAALEHAIARDDRATIRAILKDAVPEFGSTAA